MDSIQLAAVLAALVVLASMISVEIGLSVALIELALGVVAGNLFSLNPDADWLVFIATFASIVLTFLAGAGQRRRLLRPARLPRRRRDAA